MQSERTIEIEEAWITLNRSCNLRCKWCYAQGTGYSQNDNMDYNLFLSLTELLFQLCVKSIAFIGGEPTLYPKLPEAIKYVSDKQMYSSIITNGLLLSKMDYLRAIKDAGLSAVNISFKGWDQDSYIRNTGVDGFAIALSALKNVRKMCIPGVASFVLSKENILFLPSLIEEALKCGKSDFYLSFEQDFCRLDNKVAAGTIEDILFTIKQFEAQYVLIDQMTSGRFVLHQSLPFCLWNKDVISTMEKKGQLSSHCQLRERSGIIFDTDGSLLLCNSMYQVPIGKYGVDFYDKESFESFWSSEKVESLISDICKVTDKCISCDRLSVCGGGCIAFWLNNNESALSLRENIVNDAVHA